MGFCYGKRLIKEWIPATTPLSEILCSLVDLTVVGCGSLLLIHVIVVFPPAVSVLCNVDLLPIQVAKVVSKGWGIGRNGDSPQHASHCPLSKPCTSQLHAEGLTQTDAYALEKMAQ